MSEKVARTQLENLRKDPNFLLYYPQIVDLMKRSGLHDFLRTVARCQSYDGGASLERSAAAALHNVGYHDALDDIMYFDEQFLVESAQKKPVRMDFGGRKLALQKGDLVEGDFKE